MMMMMKDAQTDSRCCSEIFRSSSLPLFLNAGNNDMKLNGTRDIQKFQGHTPVGRFIFKRRDTLAQDINKLFSE